MNGIDFNFFNNIKHVFLYANTCLLDIIISKFQNIEILNQRDIMNRFKKKPFHLLIIFIRLIISSSRHMLHVQEIIIEK